MATQTTISLHPETADRLHEFKSRSQSWDDLFREILAHIEGEGEVPQ